MTDNQTPERKQLAGELKDLYDTAPFAHSVGLLAVYDRGYHDARHQGWREIAFDEITEGMRILDVSEYAGVTITREGVVDALEEELEL